MSRDFVVYGYRLSILEIAAYAVGHLVGVPAGWTLGFAAVTLATAVRREWRWIKVGRP